MSTTSLFKSPFSPKKAPPRKSITISPLQMDASERAREFGLDFNDAHMRLGDRLYRFDPEIGEWYNDESQTRRNTNKKITELNTSQNNKDLKKIQKNSFQLQEENNMLKVKNELLLDMISEIYSEMKLENEKKN